MCSCLIIELLRFIINSTRTMIITSVRGLSLQLSGEYSVCNNKNELNGTYVYRHKHNYIPCSTFAITKVQLHVSAINVGHLQVFLNIIY